MEFLGLFVMTALLSACNGGGGLHGAAGRDNVSGSSGTGGSDSGTGGATNRGGSLDTGGSWGSSGGAVGSEVDTVALPALHTEGSLIKDPAGKTVVLRGISLIDVGTLYAWSNPSNSAVAIANRIDQLLSVGMKPHAIRLPVYPRTCVNQSWPYYSPVPFPVGTPAPQSLSYIPKELTPDEYYEELLKPAIDYVTSKNMYAIVDYHQIDDATEASIADAKAFWQSVAPKLKDAPNVIFEAFNEPISISRSGSAARWAEFKPYAQELVDTIRAAAPDNLILLSSPSWAQLPGEAAASPVTGTNIVLVAHIYPGNWSSAFEAQITQALATYPVAVTEWGYLTDDSSDTVGYADPSWGTELQSFMDASAVSWTAWVADDSWAPPLFDSMTSGTLTSFGTLVRNWLEAKAGSDWIR
jgi:hypothetical protein